MEIVLCLVPYKRSNGQVSLQPCWCAALCETDSIAANH